MNVKARQCPYDPSELLGQSIGMLHCPRCGCMVIAGVEHAPCFPSFCPAADEGWYPGAEIDVDVRDEDATWLGIDP